MKGKLLSYEEIKNLKDGTKIWYDGVFYNCLAIINDNKLFDVVADECLIYVSDLKNDTEGREVYEWIEIENIRITTKEDTQSKTYKGSEVIHMIEEGILKDDDEILDKNNVKYSVKNIREGYVGYIISFLFKAQPFTIEQKPVDFMTAYNSHKKVKPEFGEYIYSDMRDYLEVIKNSSQDTADRLMNGKWFIEQ